MPIAKKNPLTHRSKRPRPRRMPHRQVPANVTAMVDAGIVKLVEAINRLPCVYTTDSCEGKAFVWFRFSGTPAETMKFFLWLSIQLNIGRLRAEWGGGDSLLFELMLPPKEIGNAVLEVRRAVDLATSSGRRSSPYSCGTARRGSRSFRTHHRR